MNQDLNGEKIDGKMFHRKQILSAKALRWAQVGLEAEKKASVSVEQRAGEEKKKSVMEDEVRAYPGPDAVKSRSGVLKQW